MGAPPRWCFEKVGRGNAELPSQFVQYIDRCTVNFAFKSAYVSAINASAMRKLLLR